MLCSMPALLLISCMEKVLEWSLYERMNACLNDRPYMNACFLNESFLIRYHDLIHGLPGTNFEQLLITTEFCRYI